MRTWPALDIRAADFERLLAALDDYRPSAVEESPGSLRVFFSTEADRALAGFAVFVEAAKTSRDWGMFPVGVREQLEGVEQEGLQVRIVADFIASMTEQQALEMFHCIGGISFGSVLKSIV